MPIIRPNISYFNPMRIKKSYHPKIHFNFELPFPFLDRNSRLLLIKSGFSPDNGQFI